MQQQTAAVASELDARYRLVRTRTERLTSLMSPEDQVVQSMPDTSPAKWHRAHTTWFFETFVLKPYLEGYSECDADYAFLFNSYYEAAGPRHTRSARGMITRPAVHEVGIYRQHIDEAMARLLAGPCDSAALGLVELGLHHEQQHQELLLMDIKHLFSLNPTWPSLVEENAEADGHNRVEAATFIPFEGGIVSIGHDDSSFSFDNELPAHQTILPPFELANRLVTCGDWLDFMADGGYSEPAHWLSDGWHTVNSQKWDAPEYWHHIDDEWWVFTLNGLRPVNPNEPVCHLSYYEADAFAAWSGARLPTEAEWEHAARSGATDTAADVEHFHPQRAAGEPDELDQLFGELWQWTSSPYTPYPGFETAPGAVGEYNGKFMVNTWVLRGSCCATPAGHGRVSYRNFFQPGTRWHFSGLRLARNLADRKTT